MHNEHTYLITVATDTGKKRWKARPRSNNPGPTVYGETREAALKSAYAAVLKDVADKVVKGELKADDLTLNIKTEVGTWR